MRASLCRLIIIVAVISSSFFSQLVKHYVLLVTQSIMMKTVGLDRSDSQSVRSVVSHSVSQTPENWFLACLWNNARSTEKKVWLYFLNNVDEAGRASSCRKLQLASCHHLGSRSRIPRNRNQNNVWKTQTETLWRERHALEVQPAPQSVSQ